MTKLLMIMLLLSFVGMAQTVAPPTNLKAAILGVTPIDLGGVVLTWDYNQDTTSTSTMVEFNIYKRMGALTDTTPFMKIGQSFHRSFIDKVNLMPGLKFSYYVTAVVNKVESDPSNMVEIGLPAPPPPPGTGKISGNLFEDSTNIPINHGQIAFIPTMAHPSVDCLNFHQPVFTDSLGNFSARLRAGDYFIYSSAKGYFSEFYDNVKDIRNATKVTVNDGDSLVFSIGLAKIVPPVTYIVSGWVKDGSGAPQKAELTAFITNKQHNPSCWNMSYFVRTDSMGNYQFKGIKPGDTLVIYAKPVSRAFLAQYYNGKSDFKSADRIGVTGDVTGINLTLVAKPVYNNGISGTVKDSSGTTIVQGSVYAFRKGAGIKDKFGFKLRVRVDTLTGAYSFANLEPGQYILLAEGQGYVPSFFRYDGTTTLNWRNADSVVVTDSSLVTGINFFLKVHVKQTGGGFAFGIVKGNDGSTLPGTLNYLLDANGGFIDYCLTDLDGSYMISNIDLGSYTMVSSLASFQDAQNSLSVDYLNSSALNVDISLTPLSTTGVTGQSTVIKGFALNQNYPNPFNPSTIISYQIPQNSFVTLKVYNILGKEVATLVNEQQVAGLYNFNFNAIHLASGIYIYKLTAGSFTSVKKLTLLK
ncbi:MAG: T9SS type A sorting domain-containing protein [Ignavibacteriaceae bacterium]|nr:T9SS type A sorting domain-containing protein [Ignavibacteriaceae bacterium]